MKKFLSLVLCLAMVFTMVGCGSKDTATSGGSKSGKVDVGIVLPTKDEPRWIQDQERFESVISSTDYSVEVLFSQGSSANEKTNVETLVAKGIKVLIICAQDAAAAASSVEAAKAAGVTVISYDRLITDTDALDYYVTFDSISVGEAMGKYLVENATGTGNPLYLYAGAATDNNAFLFFEGAWNILQPKIADGTFVIKNSSEAVAVQDQAKLTREQLSAVIGQVTTNWDFNEAKSKAEAHLTSATAADKGKTYVLAPNDGTARSIADVFAADADVSEYFITGQDSEKASVQYVIDGKQSMTVFKDTRTLAADAMNMAISVIEGKTATTDTTYNNGVEDVAAKQTPVVVVTKDNVKSALIDSGYYAASDFTGLE
jgi:putative multiple sugar transport system substrate-binding protein